MSNFYIVPMLTESDKNGKGYVHWKSWHETYTGLIDPAYMERITLEKCVDMAHRWPQNMMVAKDGDRVIGFVGYGEHCDDALTDCGEVFAIYVLAECYGQKVGYALMNAAVEKLATYKKIAVWVLKGNDRAIKFYERYGFRFDGTEKEVNLGTPNLPNLKLSLDMNDMLRVFTEEERKRCRECEKRRRFQNYNRLPFVQIQS